MMASLAALPPALPASSESTNGDGDVARLTHAVLSCDELIAVVGSPAAGAVATFVGTTRDNFEGKRVLRLEYEAYDAMAVSEMLKVCVRTREKWAGLTRLAVAHRLGLVPVGEASVIIAVSSPHRRDALEAVHFAIDELKRTVPIFKKEVYGDDAGGEAGAAWKENKQVAADAEGGGVESSPS